MNILKDCFFFIQQCGVSYKIFNLPRQAPSKFYPMVYKKIYSNYQSNIIYLSNYHIELDKYIIYNMNIICIIMEVYP